MTDKEYDKKDKEIDKLVKVNWYLMEKYGEEILKEYGVSENDNQFQRFFKVNSAFDRIYEEMCKKYPYMWCEYALYQG